MESESTATQQQDESAGTHTGSGRPIDDAGLILNGTGTGRPANAGSTGRLIVSEKGDMVAIDAPTGRLDSKNCWGPRKALGVLKARSIR